jgi:starch phosphorylase
VAAAGNVFTTHTPVAAGFDRFDPGLVDKYFREYSRSLGLSVERFLAYGRQGSSDPRASRSTWRTWHPVTAPIPMEWPSCTEW